MDPFVGDRQRGARALRSSSPTLARSVSIGRIGVPWDEIHRRQRPKKMAIPADTVDGKGTVTWISVSSPMRSRASSPS